MDAEQIIFTDDFRQYLYNQDSVLIIDKNIFELYKPWEHSKIIVLNPVESEKTLNTVNACYESLLRFGATRKTELIAIGGGVICDIAGFVAATYLRGVKIKLIPTSLLAQVDAAIGGKNGVNLNEFKNIVGTIRQPDNIIIDNHFIETLPENLLSDGYAEIIKIAAVMDEKFFQLLENSDSCELINNRKLQKEIIQSAVADKMKIVKQDTFEHGLRRILNFGHTFGHAIELTKNISHGSAVSLGMMYSAKLNEKFFSADAEIGRRISKVLNKMNCLPKIEILPEEIIEKTAKDKKCEDDLIRFVVVPEIGRAEVKSINNKEFKEMIYAVCEHKK